MNAGKPTLAIYGIQDRNNTPTPFYVHDHAITLMHHGRVLKHLTLERLTRRKHDNHLFQQVYEILKSEALLNAGDYDLVFVDNVVGRTFLSSCGRFRFEAPLNTTLHTAPEAGRCWWLDKEAKAWVVNHELAHVGACLPFYGNFKANSLMVHFDGGGSQSNFSAWYFNGDQIKLLEAHWDLKYLSGLFNANAIVFGIIGAKYVEQNSVPGKMMGLAAFGQCRADIEQWLIQNDFFKDEWSTKKRFQEAALADFGWDRTHLHERDPFLQDIVATMQGMFQNELCDKLGQLKEQNNADYLYYSGGSALNVVANTQLLDSGLFKNVFIPPCPEDSGLSLGAAAIMEWYKHGGVHVHSPYLNNWGLADEETMVNASEVQKTAEALVNGKVVAVCNNNGEIGPRALGNRSILALANSTKLAEKVSISHKQREWYRPVAPVMLERHARYFTGREQIHALADFMLLDFEVLPGTKPEIEGVVHVDGTARIQTVRDNSQNPFIYQLLEYLDRSYGVKALINTSFNVKGEPIVHDGVGAIQSAQNMHLDGVVINGIYQAL